MRRSRAAKPSGGSGQVGPSVLSEPLGRRAALATLGIGALGIPLACADQPSGSTGRTISVGRQPFAAGNSPITQYMKREKLFERAAKELGESVRPDYRDYPSALPQVEAMVGGRLDLGMWGNTPIVRAIAQGQPLTPLVVGEGHLRFVVATRRDSGIRKMEDLRGRTVGVLLGGDPHAAFAQMLRWTLGSADPKELDIELVNTPSQAQAARVPRGMDATLVGYPSFLKQRAQDDSVTGIVNTFGYTEDGYSGPEGEGAGHLLPAVRESPFYPDGFYLHRSLWVIRDEVLTDRPEVATAFAVALQRSTRELAGTDPERVGRLAEQYWELSDADGGRVVDDELLFIRKWSWITEADAWSLQGLSEFMAQSEIIDAPLEWKQVTDAIAKGADAAKAAYDETGGFPGTKEFTRETETDLRGLPSWRHADWKEPEEIPQ